MRVLLTGFGPFPGAARNPTAALIKALARRRRPALSDVVCVTHAFATSYAAVDRDLPLLFARQPDIVLMFGLAGKSRELRVETRARNALSVLLPDASGRRPPHQMIMPGAAATLSANAPIARLVGALRRSPLAARVSRDAGRYLCNYAYWTALQQARGRRTLVQFIHVPPVAARKALPARKTKLPKHRSPSLAELVSAGENLLIALIAASRR